MENIMVSVICLAYNAEKYIGQCLDGFVMQKCNFNYEVFVHDDASKDGTANIIREYEKRYPSLIHAIYQKENQYSQRVQINACYIYPHVKGKYIALCEGDDYWTDPFKLQKQVDAMEQHPECHMSVHRVKGVYEDGVPIGVMYPNFVVKSGVITGKQFIDYNCTNEYVFQTSSYFVRADDEIAYVSGLPLFAKVSATGDFARMMYFATKGDIFYIEDEMSCYRHGSTSSQARKEMSGTSEEKIQAHFNKQIDMMHEFDKYTGGRYHHLCERKINGYLFDKAVRNHEYKEMLRWKYRFFLKPYSVKARIKIFGHAFFPSVIDWYDKKKERKNAT